VNLDTARVMFDPTASPEIESLADIYWAREIARQLAGTTGLEASLMDATSSLRALESTGQLGSIIKFFTLITIVVVSRARCC
jgi:hypothetical protein